MFLHPSHPGSDDRERLSRADLLLAGRRPMVSPSVLLSVLVLTAAAAVASPVRAQTDDDCMECHDPADLEVFRASIHGGFDCVDCHTDASELPHEEDLHDVVCAECHPDVQEDYDQSVHALARAGGNSLSPDCKGCHGNHTIASPTEETAPTHASHVINLCGRCHSDPDVVAVFGRKGFDPVTDYESSVHGKALAADPNRRVATCVACHGSHAILPQLNPRSTFSKLRVPDTCGQCHREENVEYQKSMHWKAFLRGHFESPVCNDCHSEHRIISPSDSSALTHRSLVASELCARCHANKTLMDRFGLDARRFASYQRTYHGLAVLRGSVEAANCVSCHEMHAVRSSSDPEAKTYPDNLLTTCGQCHQDADEEFARLAVHPADQQQRNPVAYYLKVIYVWLIVFTIGGMLVHNLIIHSYFVRRRWRQAKEQLQVRRFQRFEVGQHLLLLTSFFLLVVSGFALKYPDSLWVRLLSSAGFSEAVRSVLHRGAALVLVTIALIQLSYLMFHRTGRRDLWALMPTLADLRGLRENLLYHLGRRSEHPRFGRFDYMEKAEYLALIWGTALMAATGFILWFPEFFVSWLPVWTFEASEVVHFYEAWLATLAIMVWHWYFVIFHPERYPMSTTWLTGTLPAGEHQNHHPDEEIEETA